MPAIDGHDAVPARRLIFWLFTVLAVSSAVVMTWFIEVSADRMAADVAAGKLTQASMDSTMLRLYTSLAGDLAAPVLVWFLLAGIASRGAWRRFWFLGALPAALMTMAVVLIAIIVAARS